MDFNNVVFCEDFSEEISLYLNKNYKNLKVLFITLECLENKYKQKIDNLYKTESIIKTVKLPDFAKNNEIFFKLIENELLDDVKLVVVFGAGSVCDLVKTVCTNKNMPFIIIPSLCSGGGYLLNCALSYNDDIVTKNTVNACDVCLVDKNVIFDSGNNFLSGCYGEIISGYIVILDLLFSRNIFLHKIDTSLLFKLNDILKTLYIMPLQSIKSKNGICELFKLMLQSENIINCFNFNHSSVESVALIIYYLNKYKLSYGHCLMVSSLFLSELFEKFFNCNFITDNILPSYSLHLKKQAIILNRSFINKLNSIDNLNQKQYLFVFNSIKSGMLNITKKYGIAIKSCFNTFKNFYHDKGLFLNKFINNDIISNAIFISSDVYEDKNILKFMKDCGLLEKL